MSLFRLFLWFSFRHIRRHRGRAITVLIGIALGAAVFTSIRLSVHASIDAFTRGVDYISGRTDYTLIRPGGRVNDQLVETVLKLPFVKSASPVLTVYVTASDPETEPFLLIGFDPVLERSVRNWEIESASGDLRGLWLNLMTTSGTLLISDSVYRHYDMEQPQGVTLEYRGKSRRFSILGKLKSDGLSLIDGGRVAITDISTFQEFTGLYGLADRIDIVLNPGTSTEELDILRGVLNEGTELASPEDAKTGGFRMINAYQLNLTVLSFVSLFVGMYLVYSLIALNAASRRHELAVLRSIGGSSRLLFALFIIEGLVFGVVGWMLALPVSTVLIRFMLKGVAQTISTLFVRIQVDRLSLDVTELIISFAITVVICILAAYQPAREAMKVPAAEALPMRSHFPANRGTSVSNRLAVAGMICIFSVWPLSCLPGVRGLPLPGYLAVFLLFAGFSLLTPWCLKLAAIRTAGVLRRMAGETVYLAVRYIRAGGIRIAVSIGALITAVALFTSIAIMVHSFRETVKLWVDQTISGDVFVRPRMAEINQYRDPISPEAQSVIRTLSRSADLMPYRRFYLTAHQFPYQFEAMDLTVFMKYGTFFWVQGETQQAHQDLVNGKGVVVSEVFASRTGTTTGDMFRAVVGNLTVALPILGVVRDYRTNGGVVYYSLTQFQEMEAAGREVESQPWGGVRIFFRTATGDVQSETLSLQQQLMSRFGDELEMVSGASLRQAIMKIFDETFSITTILLIIAISVAGLGLATTLAVLVLQRSRQLNTLMAVGASRRQIRSMILWEAVLMVLAGEIAGLICGFILSYLLVYVINYQSFGWTFLYRVNWQALAMTLPLVTVTAVAAALPAIRLVFRQSLSLLLRER